MSSKPVLSIAIPTYDRKEYVVRCLDSILPQLSDAVELLVVDNASPVPVESFFQHPQVRVVRNAMNIGYVGNFLRIFELARADWIWVVGDDDEVSPTGIATVLSHIESFPDAGHIFFSNYMGVVKETVVAHGDDAFIRCYPPGSFGARLWVSGQVFSRRVAAGHIRYAYSFPASSPHIALALLAAKSHDIVFSDREIAIHHAARLEDMWDPYGLYDQLTQMFSLNIGDKLRSHMAHCLFFFFSPYDKHFLEVLHSRFVNPDGYPEMRRIFLRRWQSTFSCFETYPALIQDLHAKVALIDDPERAQGFYDQLSEDQRRHLWPSGKVGTVI